MTIAGPWHHAPNLVQGDSIPAGYDSNSAVPSYRNLGSITVRDTASASTSASPTFTADLGVYGDAAITIAGFSTVSAPTQKSWNNGTIVGYYPDLSKERYLNEHSGFIEVQTPDFVANAAIEFQDTGIEIIRWKFIPQDQFSLARFASRIYSITTAFSFFVFSHYEADDSGSDMDLSYEYYLVPDDIGVFSDDQQAPWTDDESLNPANTVTTSSSAAAAAAGMAYGQERKSPYWDRFRSGLDAGTLMESVPCTSSEGSGWTLDPPAPGEYGRPHYRFLVCPSSLPGSTPTTPAFSDPDWNTYKHGQVANFIYIQRTGPIYPGLSDIPAAGAPGPPPLQIAPLYKPTPFRYNYGYLPVVGSGSSSVDHPGVIVVTPPWTSVSNDAAALASRVTYTVNWGDGTARSKVGHGSPTLTASHHYESPGFYLVEVTGTDENGDTITGSDSIPIGIAPVHPPRPPVLTASESQAHVHFDAGKRMHVKG